MKATLLFVGLLNISAFILILSLENQNIISYTLMGLNLFLAILQISLGVNRK